MAMHPTIYANLQIMDTDFVLEDSGQHTFTIPIPSSSTEIPAAGDSTSKQAVLVQGKMKSRRSRNPENWLVNVRKRLRQRGEDYVDRKGQTRRARKVGKGCGGTCRLRCGKLLSAEDRQHIHQQFWELTDEQKWHFYAVYVERCIKKRQNKAKNDGNVKKKFTYIYYLQKENMARVRVCKTFFLQTLDISQKRLYFFHENVRTPSGLPRAPLRGKMGSRATPDELLQQVRDHIQSFSRLPPPPGLAPAPSEEFLDAGISIRRMYELYREIYGSLAVKENVYRKVLKTDFNIKFIKPAPS